MRNITTPDAYVVSHLGNVVAGMFATVGEAMLWCIDNGLTYIHGGTWELCRGYEVHKVLTINVDKIHKGAIHAN